MKQIVRFLIRVYRSIARKVRKAIVVSQISVVGKEFQCDQNVLVFGGENIILGNNVNINCGVILQSCEGAKIIIGNNVILSYGVKIITGNLTFQSLDIKQEVGHSGTSINIGDNVWIGADVIVLPGSNIPSNTVIAAGSVVTRSLMEENYVYSGVPVKKVKPLFIK